MWTLSRSTCACPPPHGPLAVKGALLSADVSPDKLRLGGTPPTPGKLQTIVDTKSQCTESQWFPSPFFLAFSFLTVSCCFPGRQWGCASLKPRALQLKAPSLMYWSFLTTLTSPCFSTSFSSHWLHGWLCHPHRDSTHSSPPNTDFPSQDPGSHTSSVLG